MIKNFGKITRKYLGQSFDECNCLQLLYNIYKKMGVEISDRYGGYDLNTYMAYWEKEPESAIKDMISLFKKIGKKADLKFLKRGDAVIVKYKNSSFPSIYIGDNNVMVATREQGVIVMSLGVRFQPLMARRLI